MSVAWGLDVAVAGGSGLRLLAAAWALSAKLTNCRRYAPTFEGFDFLG